MMEKLRVLDLFSGIGGFSLGLERTGGFETVAFCEIDPYCRKVLAKHWPGVPQYEDIRTLTADRLAADGIAVDVITGGFPCQDISAAGKQAGIEAERSGLWSDLCRLIGEIRPKYAIVENVSSLLSGPSEQRGGWFGRVLGDLAEVGFDAEWHCISAAAVGAPHRRKRIWIVANASGRRRNQSVGGEIQQSWRARAIGAGKTLADAISNGLQGVSDIGQGECAGSRQQQGRALAGSIDTARTNGNWWHTEPSVGRVANGVSNRMDRLRGLGNAVVPQIPELIGYAILASMDAQQ